MRKYSQVVALEKQYTNIYTKLVLCNHLHLLKFYKNLDTEEKQQLIEEIEACNIPHMTEIFINAVAYNGLPRKISPLRLPPTTYANREQCVESIIYKYRSLGLQKIAEGKVAVITYSETSVPKGVIVGKYIPGILSGKSLFKLQAEMILRVIHLSKKVKTHGKRTFELMWYILVSKEDVLDVSQYLKENGYFNLNPQTVHTITYDSMPLFDESGKILLVEKNKIHDVNKGSGAVFEALSKNDALRPMKRKGIQYIFFYNTNNLLVKVADPVFIGYTVAKEADFGVKIINRVSVEEKVNLLCNVDRSFKTVLWNELPENKNSVDATDNLLFDSVDTGIYVMKLDVVLSVVDNLNNYPYHIRAVKTPSLEGHHQDKKCIVLEQHLFDAMSYSSVIVVWQVERAYEYCALNFASTSSAANRRALLPYYKYMQYLVNKNGGMTQGLVEVSPLVTYEGEDLDATVAEKLFSNGHIIEPVEKGNSVTNFFKKMISRRSSSGESSIYGQIWSKNSRHSIHDPEAILTKHFKDIIERKSYEIDKNGKEKRKKHREKSADSRNDKIEASTSEKKKKSNKDKPASADVKNKLADDTGAKIKTKGNKKLNSEDTASDKGKSKANKKSAIETQKDDTVNVNIRVKSAKHDDLDTVDAVKKRPVKEGHKSKKDSSDDSLNYEIGKKEQVKKKSIPEDLMFDIGSKRAVEEAAIRKAREEEAAKIAEAKAFLTSHRKKEHLKHRISRESHSKARYSKDRQSKDRQSKDRQSNEYHLRDSKDHPTTSSGKGSIVKDYGVVPVNVSSKVKAARLSDNKPKSK